jgi:small subunit ribosomal protein S8
MSMQDLLSDFVARVNNSVLVKKNKVEVIKNKIVLNSAKKLTALKYFNSFEESENYLIIDLNLEKLNKIIRISKPGHRKYISYNEMPRIIGGKGFNILSTSKGVLTHVECITNKIGGEILFQVY